MKKKHLVYVHNRLSSAEVVEDSRIHKICISLYKRMIMIIIIMMIQILMDMVVLKMTIMLIMFSYRGQ